MWRLAVGLLVLTLTHCYDEPRPACGFRCGPALECPDGYSCAEDGRCHRIGSDPNIVCGSIDAGVPDGLDGPQDAPRDAPEDAPDDAPGDATVIDAAVDASVIDAPPDV
ncbi:MAG: hypothetical protein WKG01_10110 [Kofleriaceae bacterium]